MNGLLSRYRSGEREQVWAELQSLGSKIRTEPLASEAREVARETMRRAKQNCEELLRRLKDWGFKFNKGPYPTFQLSRPKDLRSLYRLEETVGPFPLSVRSWYEEVGAISLMGSHPEWDELELRYGLIYEKAQKAWRQSGGLPPNAEDFYFLYTDPLVIGPGEDFGNEYAEWKENWQEAEEIEKPEPLRLPFSPDPLHKADVSGGAPYCIRIPNPQADGLVEFESHKVRFVPYLRLCFSWGGFPGFSSFPDPIPASVKRLAKDLLPI